MPKPSASNPYGWFTDDELEAFDTSGLVDPADRELAREHLRLIRRDPIYTEQRDPEFNRYLKSAYQTTLDRAAPEAAGNDRRDPLPNKPVPPWRPAAKPVHLQLSAPVGAGRANDKWDVVNAKKLLSATGHYRFDLTRERAHEPGEHFEDAIRRF